MEITIQKRQEVLAELNKLEAKMKTCNEQLQGLKFGSSTYNKKLFELRDLVQQVKVKQTELNSLF